MSWIGRLRLESQMHHCARFLTLTYNREHEPEVLPPEHLRDFLKRYRYHYGPMRFFAVGEYGDKTARPHWHLIIFGHPPADPNQPKWLDNRAWDKGFSFDLPVAPGCYGYLASYMLKKDNDPKYAPVVRQSLKPGIGFGRISEMAIATARQKIKLNTWPTTYKIGGTKYPLSQGGLEHYKAAYIKEGGTPPRESSPIGRHYDSLLQPLLEGDTYFEKKRLSLQNHRRDLDGQALPRASSKKGKLET